ncbi:MAG: P-loop NTPase [Gammaproteobacteria bacterium]|nr:P-loop NTPase [Gammaproteobacteria bacterium]
MVEQIEDQAAGLRRLQRHRPVTTIAVTGGKGGVGKTSIAINLGTALAARGRKTMLLDADLGLANVDVLLGLRTRFNLEHVINGECTIGDVIVTADSGLAIVPASSGSLKMAMLDEAHHAGLIQAFSQLFDPLDVLLIDTPAGLNTSVLAFTEAAHRIIVAVCDDPASLTDAYGLIKVLRRREPTCRIEVLASMVESTAHGQSLFDKLARVTDRFLGFVPSFMGAVPQDEHLRAAVQQQRSVVELYPRSTSARAFMRLAAKTADWEATVNAKGGLGFFVERMLHPSAGSAAV